MGDSISDIGSQSSGAESKVSIVAAQAGNAEKQRAIYCVVKRLFDIALSLAVLAIILVPSLLLCVVLAVEVGGNPLFFQERMGKGGKRFRIVKFRTMYLHSSLSDLTDKQLLQYMKENKLEEDPRVTKVGGVLRKYSIDELPNFLNVLVGNMSVVGPRAITYRELEHYGNDAGRLLSVPCGITGWWQVNGRNHATYQSGRRQRLELYYVDHACLSLDLDIILRTFGEIVRGSGM